MSTPNLSFCTFVGTLLLCLLSLPSCHLRPSESELADARLAAARTAIDCGKWQQAHITLDSVHILFPKLIDKRREARALSDSLVYLEAQRSLAYSDSLLQTLLPQTDPLLRLFRYEKNERYEDHGRYVYRSLNTDLNTTRCFLQAYVTDQRETTVKSYYYGASAIEQHSITLSSENVKTTQTGDNHTFTSGAQHEILSLANNASLELLNFISSHCNAPIQVTQEGKTTHSFWLTDNEKEALEKTYQLGLLMNDIQLLEQQIAISQAQISKYEGDFLRK